MPRKTKNIPRRKKPVKKTRARRTIARTLKPKTYQFTRSFVDQIKLRNGLNVPTGWTQIPDDHGIVQSRGFKLSDLPNWEEFKNLFSQYRIMAVSQEYYFADTGSINTDTSLGQKQIMLYANPNSVGADNAANLTEGYYLQSQTTKKRLCLHSSGRPVKLYMKVNQLTGVFSDETGNTDYARCRPKFVSTSEPNTEHYGLDLRLARIDGSDFSTGGDVYPSCKIITKVYLQCRQVS